MARPSQSKSESLVVDKGMPLPARRLVNVISRIKRCSPASAKKMAIARLVSVNGRPQSSPNAILKPGDRVEVQQSPQKTDQLPLVDRLKIKILYVDKWLVVVNKPAGLLTVPTPYREKQTLISLLSRKLSKSRSPKRPAGVESLFCVHRLDRDVSGLLVFGRSLEIARALRGQFATRKPTRKYVAIVAGRLGETSGSLRSFLATDDQLNRFSTSDEGQGELAITHYRQLQALADATVVEVSLETGRRNQIRVQFAELGHPIIGETRYRKQQAAHPQWRVQRLALHAVSLGFEHPVRAEPVEFESPLPAEMVRFMRDNRRGTAFIEN